MLNHIIIVLLLKTFNGKNLLVFLISKLLYRRVYVNHAVFYLRYSILNTVMD